MLYCVPRLYTVISTNKLAVLTGALATRDCLWFRFSLGFSACFCAFYLPRASLFILCFWCILSCLFCVVSTSASDCPERLVSKMTYYVSSGTQNSTHSLTVRPLSGSEINGGLSNSGRLKAKARAGTETCTSVQYTTCYSCLLQRTSVIMFKLTDLSTTKTLLPSQQYIYILNELRL